MTDQIWCLRRETCRRYRRLTSRMRTKLGVILNLQTQEGFNYTILGLVCCTTINLHLGIPSTNPVPQSRKYLL